jgi:UPF0271 protein
LAFRVLDSSAFYAGIPFSSNEPSVTTSDVYNEIKHIKKDHDAVQILIETRRLKISDPEQKFVIMVNNAAKKSGDFPNLSQEDISIIALSLQHNAELITDDFAVSNVAKNLSIKVIPIMTNGIKKIITWVYYCPGCKTDFSETTNCPNCGNRLKRKPGKINQVS